MFSSELIFALFHNVVAGRGQLGVAPRTNPAGERHSNNKHLRTSNHILAMLTKMSSSSSSSAHHHRIQHYIFGYGSLICSTSRSKTSGNVTGPVLPVQVDGLQTSWSVRAETAGWTPLGVSFAPSSTTARAFGVLVSVGMTELALFDERELGYQRTELSLAQVKPIPFLDRQTYYDDLHPDHRHVIRAMNRPDLVEASLEEDDNDADADDEERVKIKIWTYLPEMFKPSNSDFPIPQSYLDVILRGCLELSPRLAIEFLKHTNVVGDQPALVDDRHRHLYPRGDYEWSLQNADRVDRLLSEHRPDLLAIRRTLS
jgi:hypothetical protein